MKVSVSNAWDPWRPPWRCSIGGSGQRSSAPPDGPSIRSAIHGGGADPPRGSCATCSRAAPMPVSAWWWAARRGSSTSTWMQRRHGHGCTCCSPIACPRRCHSRRTEVPTGFFDGTSAWPRTGPSSGWTAWRSGSAADEPPGAEMYNNVTVPPTRRHDGSRRQWLGAEILPLPESFFERLAGCAPASASGWIAWPETGRRHPLPARETPGIGRRAGVAVGRPLAAPPRGRYPSVGPGRPDRARRSGPVRATRGAVQATAPVHLPTGRPVVKFDRPIELCLCIGVQRVIDLSVLAQQHRLRLVLDESAADSPPVRAGLAVPNPMPTRIHFRPRGDDPRGVRAGPEGGQTACHPRHYPASARRPRGPGPVRSGPPGSRRGCPEGQAPPGPVARERARPPSGPGQINEKTGPTIALPCLAGAAGPIVGTPAAATPR